MPEAQGEKRPLDPDPDDDDDDDDDGFGPMPQSCIPHDVGSHVLLHSMRLWFGTLGLCQRRHRQSRNAKRPRAPNPFDIEELQLQQSVPFGGT